MVSELLHILFLTLFIYLAVSTTYFLVFALAGLCSKPISFLRSATKRRIAVLIPAYREDLIICPTAAAASAHNYPHHLFQVVVIADSLQTHTLQGLKEMPVKLLELSFDVSNKAKSIYAALQLLPEDQFDIAVVLDADNIMSNGFLNKINDAFAQGQRAVQCHRVAKNHNGPVAILSGVSEEININLFRRGQVALGFSAAPLGSGMAFEFSLLKAIFASAGMLENAAEDREIDIQLLKRNIFMHFIEDAYVYDEKVASTEVFEKQRIRWFEAQWQTTRRFFKADLRGKLFQPAYFNKFFQTFLLPRLLYFVAFLLPLLVFLIQWLLPIKIIFPGLLWWLACLIVYTAVLIISLPKKFYSRQVLASIAYLPGLMFSMLRALFKIRNNRKEFLHTPKSFDQKAGSR